MRCITGAKMMRLTNFIKCFYTVEFVKTQKAYFE